RNGRTAPASGRFALYQTSSGRADLDTDLSFPGEARAGLSAGFLLPFRLPGLAAGLRAVGRERVRERDAVALALARPGAEPLVLLSDAQTGLLVHPRQETATALGPLPEENDYEDYRAVDGVQVPFTVRWSRADYQVSYHVASVRHGVEPPAKAG